MSDFIRDLRDLHVLVIHQRDRGADELLQQVNRIGCNFENAWPIPESLQKKFDLVFIDVTDQTAGRIKSFLNSGEGGLPTVIALIGYENPSTLDLIFEIGAHAVLTKPVRATGVLSAMLMARRTWAEQLRFQKDLSKLRDRLDNMQKINDAKFILMRHHGIDETEAYAVIRKQAMAKRTTTFEIAQSIINADGILRNIGQA
ncbi:Two-component response regulator, AmiR/NasT family, consists of REC and RNA-binding antiterminator (ANTAR) domains [Paracoccus thiocyanatus]|uniref:Two-component response regulator, AmiR/NasT family, consists of REC and RNA-binding antiterminator (ANTAR) domains n=1 Tax=Paracoccus thiocyanatus TaxID=34006 RepID=A0A1N6ZW68_9RHOB|nr:ANTAR domain-containing protein [Paracoccus thiocyanatus]SIR31102.1 Two-component response regulator, AmiR/NasT family, consists of REC and RNA-binding antiterminator (ANTAR) domains [Paracoccus thiocyanatus]